MSKKIIAFFVFTLVFLGFSGLNVIPVNTVFAEDGHGDNQDSSSQESHVEHQDNQISDEQNHTGSDQQNESENKTMSEHESENKTMSEHESENKTMSEDVMGQHEGEDSQEEIEHQKSNEKITHHVTDKERSHIEEAKTHRAIAAEINIDNGNVDHKSIDNNIVVQTANSSANSVNITVSATNQTGPKVILVNLNSTTIDVSSIKYLHVLYDGKVITPADSVDQVLNATSSDDPHYSILITTNGAQVLISIPHFSTHTITLDSLSKVIPAIPEFPFAILALMIGIFSIILIPKARLSIK